MPRGDRTGPQGAGPRTGRGMGYCSGYDVAGFMNPGPGAGGGTFFGGLGLGRGRGRAAPGYGMGMAWGRGTGRGRGYSSFPYFPYDPQTFTPAPLSPEDEKRVIESQVAAMKSRIEAMEKRLSELSEKEK
jgi:hypothetical protein